MNDVVEVFQAMNLEEDMLAPLHTHLVREHCFPSPSPPFVAWLLKDHSHKIPATVSFVQVVLECVHSHSHA